MEIYNGLLLSVEGVLVDYGGVVVGLIHEAVLFYWRRVHHLEDIRVECGQSLSEVLDLRRYPQGWCLRA